MRRPTSHCTPTLLTFLQVEELKKKKTKKAGTTKKEKGEATAAEPSASKADEAEAEPTTPAETANEDEKAEEKEASEAVAEQPTSPTASQPSLAQQSKLRSASFRQGSISTGPLSPGAQGPEGETATDIYRKQVARIEELEKENKRLTKESTDSEKRWKKAEEELADLRETEGGSNVAESQVEKLVSCVTTSRDLCASYLTITIRNPRSRPFNAKTLNYSNRPPAPAAVTAHHLPFPCLRPPPNLKPS